MSNVNLAEISYPTASCHKITCMNNKLEEQADCMKTCPFDISPTDPKRHDQNLSYMSYVRHGYQTLNKLAQMSTRVNRKPKMHKRSKWTGKKNTKEKENTDIALFDNRAEHFPKWIGYFFNNLPLAELHRVLAPTLTQETDLLVKMRKNVIKPGLRHTKQLSFVILHVK